MTPRGNMGRQWNLLRLLVVFMAAVTMGTERTVSGARLAAKSRWIVDEGSGDRVKLACVNWVSHLEPMVTEGLNRQPLSHIASTVTSQGFNCVRLTWALYMITRPQNLTVESSLSALNLTDAVAGIKANNPEFLQLTLLESLKNVARELGKGGLMVILDNHVSRPQWCCGYNDGNGFWGDADFSADEWVQGLTTVATEFKSVDAVVGMSLRNELRGPRSNVAAWYPNMRRGAEAVHAANPGILVIISGLNYDADLKFLKTRPLDLSFTNKVVYEMHLYSFTDGAAWKSKPANGLCRTVTARVEDHAGFLTDSAPLFVSEFGIDERGNNEADNRYITCFMAYLAKKDLDWALWTLQGSYYIRNRTPGFEETYGIFNQRWDALRYPQFLGRLQSIQKPLQDDRSSSSGVSAVYHPLSGMCLAAGNEQTIQLQPCESTALVTFNENMLTVVMSGKSLCVAAQGDGKKAVISEDCTARWNTVSASNLQLAVTDTNNNTLCLDGDSGTSVLTTPCVCSSDKDCTVKDDPQSQWFQVVSLSVATVT